MPGPGAYARADPEHTQCPNHIIRIVRVHNVKVIPVPVHAHTLTHALATLAPGIIFDRLHQYRSHTIRYAKQSSNALPLAPITIISRNQY